MNIQIGRDETHVYAMGHRVPHEHGGVAELKRRCLENLAHLDDPPDSVEFERLWMKPATARESGLHTAVAPQLAQAQAAPARAQEGRRRR